MESIISRAYFGKKLKSRVHFFIRRVHRVFRVRIPRKNVGRRSERIAAVAAKTVPVSNAETQMIAHRFAAYQFVGVVILERQRILALRALKFDF